MKAIMVMFDSLNLRHLSPYGCDKLKLPNFERLAKETVQFENHYVGSMPCMPARRELHTGRYNFLHRSWGPIEPFDDSIFEMMKDSGIYSHLITDHQHYWEDGGCTYHTRYNSFELIRGQEGDPWKAILGTESNPSVFQSEMDENPVMKKMHIHDAVNREYMDTEEKMSQTQTFDNGLEFLQNNYDKDNWFLQIETFDPHEPFFAAEKYRKQLGVALEGENADWPPYDFVKEDSSVVEKTSMNYAALLLQCDQNLGRVLDFMDHHDLWQDTMLIVNTDHGYLLGEHGWWSKTVMPMYNEIAHIPLFIHHPKYQVQGEKRQSLTQSVDIPATILDFFGLEKTEFMQGMSLCPIIEKDTKIRDYAIFGDFGKHVNITDGNKVYMRGPNTVENGPLFEYTLMPTHMRSRFSKGELYSAELVKGLFAFMQGVPCLKIPVNNPTDYFFNYGTKMFDIQIDPQQTKQINDINEEVRMLNALVHEMKKTDAPIEQYERLGLPANEVITTDWLIAEQEKMTEYKKPLLLEQLDWTESAKNVYRSYQKLMNPNEEAKKELVVELMESIQISQVTADILLKSILEVAAPSHRSMLRYFLSMAARNE